MSYSDDLNKVLAQLTAAQNYKVENDVDYQRENTRLKQDTAAAADTAQARAYANVSGFESSAGQSAKNYETRQGERQAEDLYLEYKYKNDDQVQKLQNQAEDLREKIAEEAEKEAQRQAAAAAAAAKKTSSSKGSGSASSASSKPAATTTPGSQSDVLYKKAQQAYDAAYTNSVSNQGKGYNKKLAQIAGAYAAANVITMATGKVNDLARQVARRVGIDEVYLQRAMEQQYANSR